MALFSRLDPMCVERLAARRLWDVEATRWRIGQVHLIVSWIAPVHAPIWRRARLSIADEFAAMRHQPTTVNRFNLSRRRRSTVLPTAAFGVIEIVGYRTGCGNGKGDHSDCSQHRGVSKIHMRQLNIVSRDETLWNSVNAYGPGWTPPS